MSEENERALLERTRAAQDRKEAKQERILAKTDQDSFTLGIVTLKLITKRRHEILNWLSSEDFTAQHRKIEETHQEQTGNWLIDQLQPWFNGTGPPVIICKGAGILY